MASILRPIRTGPLWLAAVLGVVSPTASAQDERASWHERPGLSGDWGGARAELEEAGIEIFATYTTGFWSNLRGGLEKGTRYEGFAQWGLGLDLERLVEWPGARFVADWHSYHGGQPSDDLIGQFANNALSGNESDDSIRFYHLYLEQELWEGAVRVKVGQLDIDDDFPDSEYVDAFLGAAYGSFTTGRHELGAPFYPVAAPGVFLELKPTESFTVKLGAYTADPGEDEKSNWGFDWGFDEGASLVAELSTQRSPLGLEGTYSFGVFGTTRKLVDFEEAGTDAGGYALFAQIDLVLLTDDGGDTRLGAFARAGLAPQTDRAVVHGYVNAALVWYEPIPGREEDLVGIGLGYTDFGSDYLSSQRASGSDVTGHEITLELTYRAQLTGWLSLQPDLQVFLDPHFARRDAVAIGLLAVITL